MRFFFANFARMKKCLFISRNYKHPKCGGGRARTDIEMVMESLGYENIGLSRTTSGNGVVHGLRNTAGVLKAMAMLGRGDVVVLQYQMKMFAAVCRAARRKGVRVICLIHDLDSFRDKTLTPDEEIPLLDMADVLLTHNHAMRRWLTEHGCKTRMIDYEIMDYLHGESGPAHPARTEGDYSLFFVGNLSTSLNDYLYQLAAIMPERQIYLYGGEEDRAKAALYPNLHLMGMTDDTEIIARHRGDFGLSWYGLSLDDGVGKVGEYMAYNNPHKVGLYLRCNAPVVVWSKAGRAEFLEREGVCLAVDSLRDLDAALSALTPDEYERMLGNVARINARLKEGHYLKKALGEALEYLDNQTH